MRTAIQTVLVSATTWPAFDYIARRERKRNEALVLAVAMEFARAELLQSDPLNRD